MFYFSHLWNSRLIIATLAIVKERQIKDPGIFGPNGGLGRALCIADIASTLAMMAGPIVSGSLHSTVGYYYMNLVYGESFLGAFRDRNVDLERSGHFHLAFNRIFLLLDKQVSEIASPGTGPQ